MRKDVRILLVGEGGVGKTSLILSLVSEEFPEEVPAKAEEITIPADVTPEKVPTHIVDYSAQEQDENALIDELMKAHVICIVYSVDDDNTIERIRTYWMPLMRRVLPEEHRRPVILVGNRSDMLDVSSMESILPIMNEFAEVETCVECSAKTLKNISEVFYYAQKAVLHPTAPLYLAEEKEIVSHGGVPGILKQGIKHTEGVSAPTATAGSHDRFSYGILDYTPGVTSSWLNHNKASCYSTYQLNDDSFLQRRCFNVPLQPQALEDVKTVVRKSVVDGVQNDGITHRGFLYLHTLFIQRGRHETTWTVLRKFGYDDNLSLNKDYLWPHLKVPMGSTAELTHQGYTFFSQLFDKYDEDGDGCLSPTELQNLFSTCPIMPWGPDVNNTVQTNAQGWITYYGYLAQWTLTTLLDVPRTLEYLAYLGYLYEHDSQLSAIHITRDKKVDLQKKQTNRNVFTCHVLGPKGVGKSSFLQGFLSRNLKYVATLSKEHFSRYALNTVSVYGQDKYLLLQEIDMGLVLQGEPMSPTEMTCDVACLLYDVTNPRSFNSVVRIYHNHFLESRVPVLIVGCKAEHPPVSQDSEMQPEEFCKKFQLAPPQMFTCLDRISKDVYEKAAALASYPNLRRVVHMLMLNQPPAVWLQDRFSELKSVCEGEHGVWVKVGVGMAVMTGLTLLVYKFFISRR